MNNKKREKPEDRSQRPAGSRNKNPERPGASGVPGGGGSRDGNIGHQAGDQNDNRHR